MSRKPAEGVRAARAVMPPSPPKAKLIGGPHGGRRLVKSQSARRKSGVFESSAPRDRSGCSRVPPSLRSRALSAGAASHAGGRWFDPSRAHSGQRTQRRSAQLSRSDVPAASEMLVACLPRCLPRLGGQEAGRRDERGRAFHPPGPGLNLRRVATSRQSLIRPCRQRPGRAAVGLALTTDPVMVSVEMVRVGVGDIPAHTEVPVGECPRSRDPVEAAGCRPWGTRRRTSRLRLAGAADEVARCSTGRQSQGSGAARFRSGRLPSARG